MRISRGHRNRASAATLQGALALLLIGCQGSVPGVEPPVPSASPRTYAADQVFSVEVWGAQAPDTTVTFPAGRARAIVLRHGPPDNTVFAEIDIPANALVAPGGADSVSLAVHPLPGIYGVTLESDAALSAPILLTFKYPVHFAAPADSRSVYPTDVLFERALVVALAEDAGTQFRTLRSTRPASDNLRAVVSNLGRYQIVAPR